MDERHCLSRNTSCSLGILTPLVFFPGDTDEADEGGAAEEENGGSKEEP